MMDESPKLGKVTKNMRATLIKISDLTAYVSIHSSISIRKCLLSKKALLSMCKLLTISFKTICTAYQSSDGQNEYAFRFVGLELFHSLNRFHHLVIDSSYGAPFIFLPTFTILQCTSSNVIMDW